jgi:hypothetical protein
MWPGDSVMGWVTVTRRGVCVWAGPGARGRGGLGPCCGFFVFGKRFASVKSPLIMGDRKKGAVTQGKGRGREAPWRSTGAGMQGGSRTWTHGWRRGGMAHGL